jgi:hypothetical protein
LLASDLYIKVGDSVGAILQLYEGNGFGFSDLMIRQAARRAGATALKTFDRKATRLEGWSGLMKHSRNRSSYRPTASQHEVRDVAIFGIRASDIESYWAWLLVLPPVLIGSWGFYFLGEHQCNNVLRRLAAARRYAA